MCRLVKEIQLATVATGIFILLSVGVSGTGEIRFIKITESSVKLRFGTIRNFQCTLAQQRELRPIYTRQMNNRTQAIFKNLQPSKQYRITCKKNAMMTTKMFKTLPAIKVTAVNESSVRFTLVGNLRDNVFNCKLSIEGQTEPENNTTLGMNDQSQDFTGLKANHTYNITCTQVGEASTLRETSTCFRTQRTEQGKLNITRSESSLMFTHSQPQTVYVCESNGSANYFKISEVGYNLTNLEPDTMYTVDCMAHCEVLDSNLEVKISAKTLPSKVTNVTKEGLGVVAGGKIHQVISWSRPSNHTSELNYIIKYNLASQPSVMTTNFTSESVNLTLPTPRQPVMYYVSVAAVSDAGQGQFSNNIVLAYDEPTEPRDLEASPTDCNEVKFNVTWNVPQNTGGLSVDVYEVFYKAASSSTFKEKSSTTTSTILDNLSPNTTYTIQVRAKNLIGFGKNMSTDMVMTPSREQGNLNITRSESSLMFTHSPSQTVYQCSLTSNGSVNQFNIPKKGGTLTDLAPDTIYKVDCVAFSNRMNLCLEVNISAKTLPSKVTNVTKEGLGVVSNGKIRQVISWSRPPHHTSELNYTIKYELTDRENPSQSSVMIITSKSKSVMLKLPTRNRPRRPLMYYVSVAAVSDAGQGQFSNKIVLAYKEPTEPRDLRASPIACNKVNVAWDGPENTGGLSVDGYEVFYKAEHSRIFQKKSSTTTSTLLDNLSPNTTYTIRVRAENAIGFGNNISTDMIMTHLREQGNLSITRHESSLMFTHGQPQTVYHCLGNGLVNQFNISNTVYTLTNLQPDTIYKVDCVAYSDEVDPCLEVNVSAKTLPGKVTNVTKEGLGVVTGDKIHQVISWSKPLYHTSELNYTIKYELIDRENQGQSSAMTITSKRKSVNLTLPTTNRPQQPVMYYVSVAAVSDAGQGQFSNKIALTYEEPTEPRDLEATPIACNKVNVTWNGPQNTGGLSVDVYEVFYKTVSSGTFQNKRSNTTSTILNNVSPNTTYTINVRAQNFLGFSNNTSDKMVKTPSRKDKGEITATPVSSTAIKIINNGSNMYHCWVNKTGSSRYNTEIKTQNSKKVRDLLPDTIYVIKCVEVGADGQYQCTEYNNIVLTGLPQVHNLMADTAERVNRTHYKQIVNWSAVNSKYQGISNYSIKYGKVTAAHEFNSNGMSKATSIQTTTALTLPLPTSPITYNVLVAAVGNKTGVGEYSQVLRINLSEPDTPKKVTVMATACNKVELAWSKPDNTGGLPIANYEVKYETKTGEKIMSLTTKYTDTSIELTNLVPNTMYTIKVRATTPLTGEYSTTSATTPNRTQTQNVSVSRTDIKVIKMISQSTENYMCWVNNINDTLEPMTTTVLSTLEYDTIYSVGCVETKGQNHQCTEYSTTVLTGLGPVQRVRKQSARKVDNMTFQQTINWEKLKSNHQNISHYSIRYGETSNANRYTSVGVEGITSPTNSTTLTLPLPTSPTTYNVWVAAVGEKTVVGEYSDLLQIEYKAPGQPKALKFSKVRCNQMKVSWEEPENDGGLPIEGYQLQYSTESGPPVVLNVSHTTSSVVLSHLLPGTMYTIKVKAVHSINGSNYAEKSKTTDKRNTTTAVLAYETSHTTIAIEISPETKSHYRCWSNSTTDNYTIRKSKKVLLSRLQPDTVYSIDCVEIDDSESYQCTEYNTAVFTGLPRPENLNVGEAKTVSSTTFKQEVNWEEVQSEHQTIKNYTLKYGPSSEVSMYNSTGVQTRRSRSPTNQIILTLPLPTSPTTYNVWVAAVGEETGVGEYSKLLQINYSAPQQPLLLNISKKCNELQVNWTAPQDTGGLPIVNYEIMYGTDLENLTALTTKDSTTRNITLSNLLPGTSYTIEVSANNSIKSTDAAITVMTPKRMNASTISIELKGNTGIKIIKSCELCTYKCWINGAKYNNLVKILNQTQRTVNGLKPDTSYTIGCVEVYKNGWYGCTEFSRTVTIGIPKAQGLMKSGKVTVNGTHISQRIEWGKVESDTQNITHYIVKYARFSRAQNITSNEPTATLTLPIPSKKVTYNVWVATVGKKTGAGEYSDVLSIVYTIPDAPEGMNVTNITCNTMILEWTEQEMSGGLPVTGYEVVILKGGEPVYNSTIKPVLESTSRKKLLDKGIEPNAPYQVQLKAINHIRTGKSAKTSVMKTLSKDDLQLQFIPRSSTWASLIITPLDNIHKNSNNYSCNISSMDEHFMVNRRDHNVTLEMLTPNSMYNVHCLVYRDGKELCYEGTANGRTFPNVPERVPSNVTLIQTTSHEFTMEWDTPEGYELNQDIAGYKVMYWTATEGDMNDTEYVANTTSYTATERDAGTVYIFQVAAFTKKGTGVYSDPVTISTIPTVENITISNIANTSAEVIWGELFDDYSIWLEITVNDNFKYGNTTFLQINATNTTKYLLHDRDPYREYTIVLYLQFGKLGNGSRENVSFRTLGTAPTESPTNTTVVTYKKKATLQWGIPPVSGRNGIITSYIIEWTSHNQQTSQQTAPINHTVSQSNFTHPEQQTRTLENLYPYTNYTWRVAAVNINGTGPFSMWNNFRTKEDVPEQVKELMVINKTTSTIILDWTEPMTPNGVITSYEVCYWRLDDNCKEPKMLNNTENSKTEVLLKDLKPGVPYKVRVTAFTSAGRGKENTLSEITFTEELPPKATVTNITIKWTSATSVNISWAPLTLHQARGFPLYVVNITTKGRVVKNLTTNQTSVKVNELNRNTVYFVTLKPLTRGGDLEGETSEQLTFGTEPTQFTEYIPIIAGAAGGLAVIVLLCIVLCIAVKVCCRSKTKQRKEEDIPLEYMNPQDNDDGVNSIQRKTPIPREGFCEYVKNMHKSKNKHFITEFSSILQHPNSTHTAADNNPLKNRYINIYPYDVSRVILMAHDGTDYINGAYVDGYSRPKAYIACQGPITTTIADFWQMIWEHKSTIIVMLTRLVEGDRPKCVQYWSEELNVAFEPGRDLVITTARIDTAPSYEVRHFEVRKTSEKADPLKVKHFLYTAWPDHGVPQYTSSMVKFILDQIKPDMKSNTAPIIVHCSAGAGRTGTFIAIDTTLDRLEEENTINIFECVEIMRTRRTQMVQNVNQYMYAHDAINDHVTCGDTYIVAHELGQKLSEMAKTKPGAEKTGFQEQFEILEKLSPEFSESDQNFAFNPKAVGKIRYVDRFTYSENYIETENEEHYVNATHIKGYYGQSGFIAAQAPMKSTIEDTWFVIREQECRVVVVLCELKEEEEEAESETSCIHFCPQEPGKTLNTDNITVTALKAEETDGYTITEVSSIEEDEEPTITTLYHYKAWKKDGRPDVPSLLKLMGDVQRSHQGSRGPLMVMCDDGMSRTGVFITVMSEIDRVKVEGEMDIFHTVKAARTARPHMVSTVLDYEVCHQIIHNYLESFDTYANFK